MEGEKKLSPMHKIALVATGLLCLGGICFFASQAMTAITEQVINTAAANMPSPEGENHVP